MVFRTKKKNTQMYSTITERKDLFEILPSYPSFVATQSENS